MHTRVSVSQLKDKTPFVFCSVKPVSISLSLTAEDNHSSDFCINHPLLLFLGLHPCIILPNVPFKNICMWMESYCVYFSLTCCFCLSFPSLICIGAFNWNTSYFLLSYVWIYHDLFVHSVLGVFWGCFWFL